ncbi:3-oxoadipate enol-lactonase [Palleronia caenipelagi]|uniref:3-oxoadipate enol-lactonase n=1 Tax=Palleronia caenipelagi TaxID=2489174 RepID=A0A547QAY5_9RHOB|nr:3-oxoadipate enol-lactonase [Palleronia caenipelagi]TRD23520.1 3-oxoadipate enol-lactonase [Palleronia caenipelagi]
MPNADLGDIRLHYSEDGDPAGAPLVLTHALGLDLTLWDAVLPLLPEGLRIIRYDARGHGLSDAPPAPYAMGALVRDLERLLDHLSVRDAVVLGLSMGGLVTQALAVKRLDLVRAMILSGTAAKIGTPALWAQRIAVVEQGGTEAIADATLEKWFGQKRRDSAAAAAMRAILAATDPTGYTGCCAAISGTDLITPTSGLRLPTLVLAGAEDGSTPPDLVRETAELIPGAEFRLIRGAGHLPHLDQPEDWADAVTVFLRRIGHI